MDLWRHPNFQRVRGWRVARLPRGAASITACAIIFWLLALPVYADDQIGDHWVATWGGSPSFVSQPVTLDNQSVRQLTLVAIGGRGQRLRIRLSNEFGAEDVVVGAAHIALAGSGGSIQPSSDHTLTFGGQQSVIIPSGTPVMSDPVNFDLGTALPNLSLVAVSLYFPYAAVADTVHPNGWQIAYITDGDTTGAASLANIRATSQSRFFLSKIEVVAAPPTIVALGDSITDGDGSTVDANGRWPDYLLQRLANLTCSICLPAAFVVNAGISGNRLLHNDAGPSALARFDRDVLSTPGVRYVILLEGINDIGRNDDSEQGLTANDLTAGYQQAIGRAHSKGVYVYGGTMTPFHGKKANVSARNRTA